MTLRREVVDAYWQSRTAIEDPEVASRHRHSDAKEFDLAFIAPHLSPGCEILDLGAGSCVLADRLADRPEVARVRAVEKFAGFFDKRPPHPRVETFASDVRDYRDDHRYHLVLLFGVMNYFHDGEAAALYARCHRMLRPDGRLLVKHQCGVGKDVVVDHHSAELGHTYQAIYRAVEHEVRLLGEHFSPVEVVDVYPPRLNRWDNTHFHGFVCAPR